MKPVTLRQEKLAAELAFAPSSRSPSPSSDALKPFTHVQEQKKLREETVAAFHTAISGDASDGDDLLVPRELTKDELEREEEEYQGFLHREVGEDLRQLIEIDQDVIGIHESVPSGHGDEEDEKKKKKKKKDKGKGIEKWRSKTKEEKDREFLMKFVFLTPIILRAKVTLFLHSYILNRGWIDRSAKRLPTYTEVTSTRHRKKESKGKGPANERGTAASSSGASSESEAGDGSVKMIDDEDEFDDVADVFESSYNFRFEEPYVHFLHSDRPTETSIFTLPKEMRLKLLVTRVTSPL